MGRAGHRHGARTRRASRQPLHAPHEHDLLPGLPHNHRDSEAKCSSISLTMRWNTPSADRGPRRRPSPACRGPCRSRRSAPSAARRARGDGRRASSVSSAALHDRAAALVARPVHLGRQVHVVVGAAALADPPAGDPIEHDIGGDVDIDHRGRATGRRAHAGTTLRPAAASAGSRRARSRRRAVHLLRSGRRRCRGSRCRRAPAHRGRGSPRPPCRRATPRQRPSGTDHRSTGPRRRSARTTAWPACPCRLPACRAAQRTPDFGMT